MRLLKTFELNEDDLETSEQKALLIKLPQPLRFQ